MMAQTAEAVPGSGAPQASPFAQHEAPLFPLMPRVPPLGRQRWSQLYNQALALYEEGAQAELIALLRREERYGCFFPLVRSLRWQIERDLGLGPWAAEPAAPVAFLLPLSVLGFFVGSILIFLQKFKINMNRRKCFIIFGLSLISFLGPALRMGYVKGRAMGVLGGGATALSRGAELYRLPDTAEPPLALLPAGKAVRVLKSGGQWALVDFGERRAWVEKKDIIMY